MNRRFFEDFFGDADSFFESLGEKVNDYMHVVEKRYNDEGEEVYSYEKEVKNGEVIKEEEKEKDNEVLIELEEKNEDKCYTNDTTEGCEPTYLKSTADGIVAVTEAEHYKNLWRAAHKELTKIQEQINKNNELLKNCNDLLVKAKETIQFLETENKSLEKENLEYKRTLDNIRNAVVKA